MTTGAHHARGASRPREHTAADEADIAPPASDDIALDTLALRIAEELAHLTRLSLDVQDGLSRCIGGCPRDASVLTQLQAIDRIGQGLADLGRLMAGLTGELSADITLPAAVLRRDLRLRDLADRLVPLGPARGPGPGHSDGDILWF